jgi:hypothetical protein
MLEAREEEVNNQKYMKKAEKNVSEGNIKYLKKGERKEVQNE